MSKIRYGSIFAGFGVALTVLGLCFVFFSSFHIEPTAPTVNTISVIGHYLEGIAIGTVFVSVGVLMAVFAFCRNPKGMRKLHNDLSDI